MTQLSKYKKRIIIEAAIKLGSEFERFSIKQLSDRLSSSRLWDEISTVKIIHVLAKSGRFELFRGSIMTFSIKRDKLKYIK